MIKLSVIIPVYNAERYVENSILSVLNQKNKDIQIIIVNDGSTDDSFLICDKLRKKHKNIELYSQENKGVGSARNTGIKYAAGKYITFLDADDCIPRGVFNKVNKIISSSDADLFVGNIECFNDVRTWHLPYMNKIFNSSKESGSIKDLDQLHLTPSVCNKWFKSSVINENNIRFNEDINIGEDLLFVEEYYLKSHLIIMRQFDVYRYRLINTNSLIKKSDARFFENLLVLQKLIINLYKDNNEDDCSIILKRQVRFYIDSICLKISKLSDKDLDEIINIGINFMKITLACIEDSITFKEKEKIILYELFLKGEIYEIKNYINNFIKYGRAKSIIYENNIFYSYLVNEYKQYKDKLVIKPNIISKVENVKTNENKIILRGYLYVKGMELKDKHIVEKVLVIKSNNYIKYIKLENDLRTDITFLNKNDNLNYDWAGYKPIELDIISDFPNEGIYSITLTININGIKFETLLEFGLAEIKNRLKTKVINSDRKYELDFKFIENKYLRVSKRSISLVSEVNSLIKTKVKSMKYDYSLLRKKRYKSLIVIIMYKLFGGFISKKNIWVMGEREDTAQDNTYHLYKYIKEIYKDINAQYVITDDSKDIKYINEYGKHISFGSIKHTLYMLCAEKVINSYTFRANMETPELKDIIKYYPEWYDAKKVFLQHGVIGFSRVNQSLHKNRVDYDLFITSSEFEKQHIIKEFGYDESEVVVTGLARWDNLNNDNVKRKILLMPTWRSWITSEEELLESNYFKTLYELLISKDLIRFLEERSYTITFFPHYQVQKLISKLNIVFDKNIEIVYQGDKTVQSLINEHELLITDYSTVSYDFKYLNKDVIFYQFDYEEFYTQHYNEGPINHKRDLFGIRAINLKQVVESLNSINYLKLSKDKIPKLDHRENIMMTLG
ncbi:MAG: CDP-glycerol glycerophosphotransferase family protein [Clostridium sp.]